MSYRIEIQPEAENEIEEAYQWIFEQSPENARRWRQRLLEKIRTLAHNPQRCPLAHENDHFPQEIRELLYGKRRGVYRILFTIVGETVSILHVRHAARRFLDE
jgi:plasmid stabilization system protein ParE